MIGQGWWKIGLTFTLCCALGFRQHMAQPKAKNGARCCLRISPAVSSFQRWTFSEAREISTLAAD